MMRKTIPWSLIASLVASGGAAHAQQEIKPPGRRIVGGEAASIKLHPWQVALQLKGGFACGGSIIRDRWILTAAHCFDRSSNQKDWRVKAAVTDHSVEGKWNDIERVVVHKGYDPNAYTYENDIALIKVRALPAGGKVIPLASDTTNLAVGQPLEVTGWGETSFGGTSPTTLMKVTVPYVGAAACNAPKSNAGKVKDGMLCAGYPEGRKDACRGDSGGPLVWRTRDGPVLVGVVSWGQRCAEELKFGVYTRVTAYRDWIDRVIATDGK